MKTCSHCPTVAYNAYLLVDEKTVLIDTVGCGRVTRPFLENIEAALDGRPLDFLVVNHMEPDHCANIEALAARYPAMKIVGNRKTFSLMAQFYDFDVALREYEVKEGDRLPIGRRTLRFTFAPMVHWPEVMLTLEETEGVLFSADAFGAFGAFSGNLFSAPALYESRWLDEARRYYANIVGRYGGQVQRVLGKLAGADIRMICPAHGPIWRENLPYILEKYESLEPLRAGDGGGGAGVRHHVRQHRGGRSPAGGPAGGSGGGGYPDVRMCPRPIPPSSSQRCSG